MKKLRLQLEQLHVESFPTAAEQPARGTVRGHCETLQESGCATHEYSCAHSGCGSCAWTCHSCGYTCNNTHCEMCTMKMDCQTAFGCGGGGGGGGSGPGTGCEPQPY